MFFMASYDIDRFRSFVFDSSFLQRYSVDEPELAKLRSDDVALLEFGLKWLKGLLFREGGPQEGPKKQD
jgi:hypothetical protein